MIEISREVILLLNLIGKQRKEIIVNKRHLLEAQARLQQSTMALRQQR